MRDAGFPPNLIQSGILTQQRQAPLPSPDELEVYQKYDPNCLDRLISLHEESSKSQNAVRYAQAKAIEQDAQTNEAYVRGSYRFGMAGIVGGCVVLLTLIAATVFLAIQGKDKEASYLGGLGLSAPVIALFIKYLFGLLSTWIKGNR